MQLNQKNLLLNTFSCSVLLSSALLSPLIEAHEADLLSMSLEELLQVKVSTASLKEQSVKDAPARVEVITRDDLERRNYKNLSFLFDDLAGVAVTRTYGDNYFNVFWRGVRHTIGNSMQVLLDGVKLNNLYTNETEIIAALPISSIDHIEIVYGPASVIYGSDAVVGIINIITEKKNSDNLITVEAGSNQRKTIDLSLFHLFKNYQLRLATRIEKSETDFSNANKYLWTDPSLLRNSSIWGEFAEQYGEAESPRKHSSFDLSLFNKTDEFRIFYGQIASGYGLEYTFDHSLPNAGTWYEPEYSAYWKHRQNLSDDFSIESLLRYRNTTFDKDSRFIESYLSTDGITSELIRLVDVSYWQSINRSKSLNLKSSWQINNRAHWVNGLDFDFQSLQKAYNINYGPSLQPQDISLASYNFPVPPDQDMVSNNRKNTAERSLFSLLQYQLGNSENSIHTLHFGLRYFAHSEFDNETTIRSGYVGEWKNTTFKLFYGEAYQVPPPRLLYGGWQGSGSDPDLQPRTANTLEANLDYHRSSWRIGLNLYQMNSNALFNSTSGGAVNAGEGKSTGGDLSFRLIPALSAAKKLSLWGAYSWLDAEEQVTDSNGNLSWHPVGDIAKSLIHYGVDFDLNNEWQVNLRGRYYGPRKTVESNPLGEVAALNSHDLNITYHPTAMENFKLSLDINNLTDSVNFHPGVRSAGASLTNNGTDSNGLFLGSGNFYNSQIAQPGREYRLSVRWRF